MGAGSKSGNVGLRVKLRAGRLNRGFLQYPRGIVIAEGAEAKRRAMTEQEDLSCLRNELAKPLGESF